MSTGPITRSATLNELYGPLSHGPSPQAPHSINWTYVLLGATIVVGGCAVVYFYTKRSQDEISAQTFSLHQKQMAALDSQATAHRDTHDKITSRLDRFEQGANRTIQLLENIAPSAKVLADDITPIVETIEVGSHKSNSITK